MTDETETDSQFDVNDNGMLVTADEEPADFEEDLTFDD